MSLPAPTPADLAEALFVDDDELHRRLMPKMGRDRFRAIIRALEEKQNFPQKSPVWGARYWPAVRAWLDAECGLGNIAMIEDGPETFDAAPQSNPRSKARPHHQRRPNVLLDGKAGRTRPNGVPGSVHQAAGGR